jgi:hypothetical protein
LPTWNDDERQRLKTYRTVSVMLAILTVGLGIALLAATLARGSGGVGILLGVLFIVAGAGRLYLARGGRR